MKFSLPIANLIGGLAVVAIFSLFAFWWGKSYMRYLYKHRKIIIASLSTILLPLAIALLFCGTEPFLGLFDKNTSGVSNFLSFWIFITFVSTSIGLIVTLLDCFTD